MLSFLCSHAVGGLDSMPKIYLGLAILARENCSYKRLSAVEVNIFSLTEQRDVVGIYNWKDAGPRVRRPGFEY